MNSLTLMKIPGLEGEYIPVQTDTDLFKSFSKVFITGDTITQNEFDAIKAHAFKKMDMLGPQAYDQIIELASKRIHNPAP